MVKFLLLCLIKPTSRGFDCRGGARLVQNKLGTIGCKTTLLKSRKRDLPQDKTKGHKVMCYVSVMHKKISYIIGLNNYNLYLINLKRSKAGKIVPEIEGDLSIYN